MRKKTFPRVRIKIKNPRNTATAGKSKNSPDAVLLKKRREMTENNIQ